MTQQEGRVIAFLRSRFRCDYRQVGGICVAIMGWPRACHIAGLRAGSMERRKLGKALVARMEACLGLEPGEADSLLLSEEVCAECGQVQWALGPASDTPRECDRCGEIASLPGREEFQFSRHGKAD